MKNITAQYRDLLEGKMSKSNFMRSVRMQFPDYISPVNSYEDMISILKSKRIIKEMDIPVQEKPFYLVDETGKVIDSTMAANTQAATEYFENEFEMGIPSNMTVTDMNPEEIEEAMDTEGIEALRKGALREAVEKTEGSYKKVTGKEQYSIFNEIDRVNPYELKKGIAIEMGMQYEPTPNFFTDKFNPEALAKATRKVLKNLEKDPAYYTNMISLEFEKKSGMLQKPKELKVGSDGSTKIKGFSDAKSNTEENLGKKERAKGRPEGVKEMKPSKKSMGGIKTMKTNGKVPKGVEMMKESSVSDADIVKKYNQMMGSNPQTKFSDVAKALNVPESQVQSALAMSSMPKFESKEEKIKKIKEAVVAELKKRLSEKIDQADIADAKTTGDTLNIPASDTAAVQAAKNAKVTYTTYK